MHFLRSRTFVCQEPGSSGDPMKDVMRWQPIAKGPEHWRRPPNLADYETAPADLEHVLLAGDPARIPGVPNVHDLQALMAEATDTFEIPPTEPELMEHPQDEEEVSP